jgi:predicted type IV restriction endonuclease
VTDILAEMFGYDKYSEVTSEFAIRGTACDLAIKVEGKVQFLIEVKAIGLDPKDNHLKQAVDYGANQGVEWVVLTNGHLWRIYRVIFGKPISQELVGEFDLLSLDCKSEENLQLLYLLSKEALSKDVLDDFHNQRQALSRFSVAAMLLTDPVLAVVRRELRRLSPDVKIDVEQIKAVMTQEVLKREVLEGEKAEESRRKINRLAARAARAKETPDEARQSAVHPALQAPTQSAPATSIMAATAPLHPPPASN